MSSHDIVVSGSDVIQCFQRSRFETGEGLPGPPDLDAYGNGDIPLREVAGFIIGEGYSFVPTGAQKGMGV